MRAGGRDAHHMLVESARFKRGCKLHQKGLGAAGVQAADDMHHPRHTGPATKASCVNNAASS